MVYPGRVRNGVVVLDATEGALPEGAEVVVQVRVETAGAGASHPARSLLDLAGKAVGLPSDMSRNHDHYLYGAPKR